MIQGATYEQIFKLPVKVDLIKEVRITYTQDDEIIVEKTQNDCELNDTQITVSLSQEDTFRFDPDKLYEFQIVTLTTDGKVIKSVPRSGRCIKSLNKEVLV